MPYAVLKTQDGSPSLLWQNESMHHRGGAYSETQYLYGKPLRALMTKKSHVDVLVVGLGLGYIEILAALESLKNKVQVKLLSYESDPILVESLLFWLERKGNLVNPPWKLNKEEPSYLVPTDVFDQIYTFFQSDYPQEIDALFEKLMDMYYRGEWLIQGALDEGNLPSKAYEMICFDAFSGKSLPQLWTEPFLQAFLAKSAAPSCVFTTFACTGTLKRSLKAQGFTLNHRQGFESKRDSTLATRQLDLSFK